MKIEYRYSEKDKSFFSRFKSNDIYDKICLNIQKLWFRIHVCHDELIKLYCKQANIKNKDECRWGICTNDMSYLPEMLFDCSVGQIRKMRNHIRNDDGTCKTCPYFVNEETIRTYRSLMKDEE
jgi:hypothetical protein